MPSSITSFKKLIEQHPNEDLQAIMATCFLDSNALPTDYVNWLACLQDVYIAWLSVPHTATLTEFCLGVYNVWTDPQNVPKIEDRVTSVQLTKLLTDIKTPNADFSAPTTTPAFPDSSKIDTAVKQYYLDIVITINAQAILNEHDNSQGGNAIYIGNFVSMTDNHSESSTGEGTDELNSEGLQPNMTITWTGVAKNHSHSIQLTQFLPNDSNRWTELAPMPTQLANAKNQWTCKANATLPQNFMAVYHFNLTIDNGKAVYWFDPYMGDKKAKRTGTGGQ